MTTTPVAPAIAISVSLDPRWAIDAMFGGAIGVAIVDAATEAAIQAAGEPGRVLSSLNVAFVRPAAPGPATVFATIVPAGRSSSVVACTLVTDAGVAATAIVTLVVPALLALEDAAASDPALPPDTLLPATLLPDNVPPEAPRLDGALAAISHRVDWRAATAWGGGELEAWIRPREQWPVVDGGLDPTWFVVAADLLGPALAGAGIASPFRIATTVLDVQVLARSASPWVRQSLRADSSGRAAVATLELHSPAGTRLAIATQRAIVLPASVDELPFSVTGFGWGGPIPVSQE